LHKDGKLSLAIRTRHAFIYPGVSKIGATCVIVEDKQVSRVAVGSFPGTILAGMIESFSPETVTVATDKMETAPRPIAIPWSVRKLRVARSGWFDRRVYHPDPTGLGKLGYNSYKMMFSEMMIRGPYLWGKVDTETLDEAWVRSNSPPRILK